MGFDSKCDFAPPTILLGLLLCPFTWGISFWCLRRPYKWLSKEALQIAEKRREAKSKGDKERYIQLNAQFQIIARRNKKAFLSNQCKETAENNKMGKTRYLFKKVTDTKGTFHAKMGTIKDRNGMDLIEAEEIRKRWQEDKQKNYTEKILMTQITMMVWSLT